MSGKTPSKVVVADIRMGRMRDTAAPTTGVSTYAPAGAEYIHKNTINKQINGYSTHGYAPGGFLRYFTSAPGGFLRLHPIAKESCERLHKEAGVALGRQLKLTQPLVITACAVVAIRRLHDTLPGAAIEPW